MFPDLLVKVCVPVSVATVESMFNVTEPEVPPPDNPVPAVTPVISPLGVSQATPEPVEVNTCPSEP